MKKKKKKVVAIMSYAPSLINLRLLTLVKIKSKLCVCQLFEFISHIYVCVRVREESN